MPKQEENILAENAKTIAQNSKEGSLTGKPYQIETSVDCHTDYSASSGHSCVNSGGYLFKVYWTGVSSQSSGLWHSVQVTSCGC